MDMDRCPQSTDEFRDYFYALIGKTRGNPAMDYEEVLSKEYPWQGQMLMIPEGVGPGVRLPPDAPFFGLTQQYSGVPKGRVFLPSNQPDPEGYYTTAWQYLDDAPGSQPGTALVWSWYYIAGNAYSPLLPESEGGGGPYPSGISKEEVQAMIDEQCVKFHEKIALRSNSGTVLCMEGGGPTEDNQKFEITSRSSVGPWESLTVEKGQ